MAFDMKDYREVPERIAEWFERNPNGRIVCEVVEFTDSRVTVKASAYRTSIFDEPPAGVGHSYLAVPGSTPYTKGSELENAETSAAGRALVMAGIPAKNVASAGEVRSKESSEVEPGADVSRRLARSQAVDGMADEAEAGSPAYGEGADGSASTSTGDPNTPVAPDVSAPSGASPEQEQADAYIQVLRDGPGNTQSVLQARALFESDARKVRNLRDLTTDELLKVVQSFSEKREAVSS